MKKEDEKMEDESYSDDLEDEREPVTSEDLEVI